LSGILCLLRTDGAPIEPRLFREPSAALALRGPDRDAHWSEGPLALRHTLLRTGPGSDFDRQPLTLDQLTWIVADARVDARDELTARLEADADLDRASDAELILRAYAKWGHGLVDHLLGDYAFVIWDSAAKELFCARDHLGVKPLYYANAGPWLVVSNAIECVRDHPDVSDRLNDLAIADFLLFGFNLDPAATAFRDVGRLPPAHTLTWASSALVVRRYWTLPIDEPVYFRRSEDYIDRFKELRRQAISDRLRTDRISVFMSGGIDSPSLAAAAADLLGQSSVRDPVRAFTFINDSSVPDPERHYAAMAAEHLGLPIHYYETSDRMGWDTPPDQATPEPSASLSGRVTERGCYAAMAGHSRTAFYGEGPDNALLYEWKPYLTYLMRQRHWNRLLADAAGFVAHHRRVPLLPSLPRLIRTRRGRDEPARFPEWLSPDLVRRLGLLDRWREATAPTDSLHPVRPIAYGSLRSPIWQSVFETLEPSCTGSSLEVRHPYLDTRLLRFLLRVPVVPWCRQKHLLRRAARGVLPEPLLRRPKTPLANNPDHARVRRYGLPRVQPSEALAGYGSADTLSAARPTSTSLEADLRFVALSYWLHDRDTCGRHE
jgi:asparagine synthase (glutamine-hydrolysing)